MAATPSNMLPLGTVAPGVDYETLRDEIIGRLQELCDPETGEPVVQEIYRREDIYHGPASQRAADILFIPTRMEYFGFGEYEFGSNRVIEAMKRGISGTHRMNGVLLMRGEPVRPGGRIGDASLYDLAPTILHLMGEPVPSDMDGRVLTEALTAPHSDPSRVRYVEMETRIQEAPLGAGLDAEAEAIIVDRLRDLGYVG